MKLQMRIFVALVALVVVGLALWPVLGIRTSPEIEDGTTQNNSGGAGRAAAADAATPPATAGRFALRYAMRFDAPAAKGGRSVAEVQVRAALELAPGVVLDGTRWVAARITDATVTGNDAGRAFVGLTADADAAAALGAPFFLGLQQDGSLRETRFSATTAVGARGLLASIAAELQLSLPSEPGAASWTAIERDANGAHEASYSRDGQGRIVRTVAIRPENRRPDGPEGIGYELQGRSEFALRAGRLEALDARQDGRVSTGVGGADDRARFHLEVELHRQGDVVAAWSFALDPHDFMRFDASAAPAPPREGPSGASYQELLGQADRFADKDHWRDRSAVANDLARTLREQPELCERIDQDLRLQRLSDAAQRTVIEGLVRSGTPRARRVLTDVAADPKAPRNVRGQVLAGATAVQTWDVEFARALHALAFNDQDPAVRSRAAIALGAAVQHGQEQNDAHATAAAKEMATHAAALLTTTEQAHAAKAAGRPLPAGPGTQVVSNWIAALGNAATADALPTIFAALQDYRIPVRMAAALALRFYPAEQVLPRMQELMRDEPISHVRDNAVQAARYLGPDATKDFVVKALGYDKSAMVRLSAAHTIAAWAAEAPALRQLLVDALAREGDAKVRGSLRAYIEPGWDAPGFRAVANAPGQAPAAGHAPAKSEATP